MKRFASLVLLCLVARAAAAQEPVRLTLDDAIARGLANSHRIAELQARREGAEATETEQSVGVDAVAVLSWRLHANQSRPGVCDSAARRSCARRLSRYPGQLPGTARSGLAGVFSGPNRCPGTSRRCGAQGHRGRHSRGAIRSAIRDHACILGARIRDRIRARRHTLARHDRRPRSGSSKPLRSGPHRAE